MRIEFRVQGSEAEPYKVSFWREGTNLKSFCTCRAGKSHYACKHRFAMLDADVTNLVSENYDDIGALQELIEDTDVSEAYRNYLEALDAQKMIQQILPISPGRRRSSIELSTAIAALTTGGIAKGSGNANSFDVYQKDLAYLGSVKTKYSVFNTDVTQLFSGIKVTSSIKTDKLNHDASQRVIAYAVGGDIDIAFGLERSLPDKLKAFKDALVD